MEIHSAEGIGGINKSGLLVPVNPVFKVNFCCRVIFTRENKIEAMYERCIRQKNYATVEISPSARVAPVTRAFFLLLLDRGGKKIRASERKVLLARCRDSCL